MERIGSINPERLKWCCEERGISPEELAQKSGATWGKFSEVLEGSGDLTYRQLKQMADYCGRSVLFFLEKGPVEIDQLQTPQFRTLSNQKPELSAQVRSLIERVEHHRDIYLALHADDDIPATYFDPPEVNRSDVPSAALEVRKWLGLQGTNDFASYREAVEAKGVLVFVSNGYKGKWQVPKGDPTCGFSLYDDSHPVIFVTKQDFVSRQAFTLMHELGHLVLHQSSSIDSSSDLESHLGIEREANLFAGHLLVPDEEIAGIELSDKPINVSDFDNWLRPLRRKLGVSSEAIILRLMDSHLVSESEYDRYRALPKPSKPKQEGGARFRHKEPAKVLGDRFVRTVLNALYDDRITLAKASTYLDNLKITDLHKLEKAYAGI